MRIYVRLYQRIILCKYNMNMLTDLTCVLCDLCFDTKTELVEHKKMCIINQIVKMKEDNEEILEKELEEKDLEWKELEEKEKDDQKEDDEVTLFSFYISLVDQQTEIMCQTKEIEKQYDVLIDQASQIEEQNKLIQLLFLNGSNTDY